MLTTTHILVGAAVTTRPHFRPWQITLGWLGGFAPDASIFFMFAVSRVLEMNGRSVWRKPDGMYWQEPWQTFSAISNSVPTWALLAVIGFLIFRKSEKYRQAGLGLLIFSAAALTHTLGDFPVHTDDAHVHFWPLTDWRFHSPISYYRSSHFGDIFRIFEMGLNAVLAIYLVLRFKQWPVRILAVLIATSPFVMRAIVGSFF